MITDLTYLNNMSGGGSDIIKEMITIFISQTEEYIVDMQKLLKDKDYTALGKLAHKAKSSVAIMGMNDLAADLKSLELLTKDNKEVESYPVIVDKFVKMSKQAIIELSEHLKTL
jgi:HPt (histidine-containing phosphotransfer) domain-containing protein